MIETFSDPLPDEIHHLATSLMRETCDQGLMLAVAESCTGGLLAAVLTDVEGCAHGFDRGFVVYTDDAKHEILGLERDLLSEQGAVSAPAARAFADGAIRMSKADFALSITGFAGPGAPDEEAGLVYLGLAWRSGDTRVAEYHFGPLSRAEVRRRCLRESLAYMLDGLSVEAGGLAHVAR